MTAKHVLPLTLLAVLSFAAATLAPSSADAGARTQSKYLVIPNDSGAAPPAAVAYRNDVVHQYRGGPKSPH